METYEDSLQSRPNGAAAIILANTVQTAAEECLTPISELQNREYIGDGTWQLLLEGRNQEKWPSHGRTGANQRTKEKCKEGQTKMEIPETRDVERSQDQLEIHRVSKGRLQTELLWLEKLN